MSDFNEAMKVLLNHEGGYVDNPDDKGGPTNRGITQKDLSQYLGRPASIEDLQMLSINQTMDIYKKNYWVPLSLDQINKPKIATVIFDLSILTGMRTVVRLLQDILKLTPDGIIGKDTIKALNAYSDTVSSIVLIEQIQKYFVTICHVNNSQVVFLTGWINRTHSLIDYVLDI